MEKTIGAAVVDNDAVDVRVAITAHPPAYGVNKNNDTLPR